MLLERSVMISEKLKQILSQLTDTSVITGEIEARYFANVEETH